MRVFSLIAVEPCYSLWIQEVMKQSATVSPLASVFHEGDVPQVLDHAYQ